MRRNVSLEGSSETPPMTTGQVVYACGRALRRRRFMGPARIDLRMTCCDTLCR